MTSYSRPTPEQIDKAIALLTSSQHCRKFFGKLENPEWVKPLREKGCFRHPPEPVKSEDGVAHPAWPASQYLARMASAVPQEVFASLDGISTSNARVIADICDAAINMPGNLAEALSVIVLKAAKKRVWPQVYADEIADLASKLAGDGRIGPAITLADALFYLKSRKSIGHAPVGGIDPPRYGQLLAKVTRAIAEHDSSRAMEWSCGLLVKAASFHVGPESRNEFDDASYAWPPTVERQRREHSRDVADSIVTSVCDVSEKVVRDRLWPLAKVVKYLEDMDKLILSRIALHLVRIFGDADTALARHRMLDRELFDNYRYRHEYAMLLRDRFGILSPDERKMVLSWIDRGPDRDETREVLKTDLGDGFREELVDQRTKAWQRDRLSWFCNSLPSEWSERYAALVAEVGPPRHADLTFWSEAGSMMHGNKSPKTAEQLATMDTASAVEFLQSWHPDPEDSTGESMTALANELRAAVREDLARFSSEAPAFAVLHPAYVTSLLGEIAVGLQNQVDITLEPVADLCLAVVKKSAALSPERCVPCGGPDSNMQWEYARNEVATVVTRLCDRNAPLHLRETLWQTLSALEDAPDKSYIVGEPEEDFRLVTWLDHACNNPKARWVHAVIRYAIWIKKQTASEAGVEEASVGMAQIPEAADTLARLLEPRNPSSPAVRSEFGQSFPALCWLDRQWSEQHAAAVFRMSGAHSQHGWAAWNSYLVANRAYDGVFRILEIYYSHAVDSLEQSIETADSRFNPLECLAEHLMVLCGRGILSVDQPNGLLMRFFSNAPTGARAHAIKTVGRSLKETQDVPTGVVERFTLLWEWFWRTLVEGQEGPVQEGLAAFGWWLICGKFDDEWCIDRLLEVTGIQPQLDPEHRTMVKLSALARIFPDKVVTCADRMVRGDRNGWRTQGWKDTLRSLLNAAMNSGNSTACATAKRLIEHLGRRGFLEFGSILRRQEDRPPSG